MNLLAKEIVLVVKLYLAESISNQTVRVCLCHLNHVEYLCSTPKNISHVFFYFFVSSKFHAFSDAEKFRKNS